MKKETLYVVLIQSWVIGMVVVVVYFLMHLQHVSIGLFLGIIHAFLTDRLIDTLLKGNQSEVLGNKALVLKALKSIGIAVTISLMIRGIDYILLKNHIIEMPIEPFRFIIFYQTIYYSFKTLYRKMRGFYEKPFKHHN